MKFSYLLVMLCALYVTVSAYPADNGITTTDSPAEATTNKSLPYETTEKTELNTDETTLALEESTDPIIDGTTTETLPSETTEKTELKTDETTLAPEELTNPTIDGTTTETLPSKTTEKTELKTVVTTLAQDKSTAPTIDATTPELLVSETTEKPTKNPKDGISEVGATLPATIPIIASTTAAPFVSDTSVTKPNESTTVHKATTVPTIDATTPASLASNTTDETIKNPDDVIFDFANRTEGGASVPPTVPSIESTTEAPLASDTTVTKPNESTPVSKATTIPTIEATTPASLPSDTTEKSVTKPNDTTPEISKTTIFEVTSVPETPSTAFNCVTKGFFTKEDSCTEFYYCMRISEDVLMPFTLKCPEGQNYMAGLNYCSSSYQCYEQQ